MGRTGRGEQQGVACRRRRTALREAVLKEEARRICAAYIGDQDVEQTVEQEILYRLRAPAADLVTKDAERDRLAGKARALRVWINDSTRTQAELDAFDARTDTHWEDNNDE